MSASQPPLPPVPSLTGLAPTPPEEPDTPYVPTAEDWEELTRVAEEGRDAASRSDHEARAIGMDAGDAGEMPLPPPDPLSKYAIKHDRYDEHAWQQVCDDNPGLTRALTEGMKAEEVRKLRAGRGRPYQDDEDEDEGEFGAQADQAASDGDVPPWPYPEHLALDMYSALYKAYPEFEEHLHPHYLIDQVAMRALLDTPEYATLHGTTQGDDFASGVGISALAETVLRDADLRKIAEALANAQEPEQDDNETDQEFATRLRKWRQEQAANNRKMRLAAKAAMSKAQQDVGDANSAVSAFGGQGLGEGTEEQTMNAKQKAALARKVMQNRQLRAIIQFAGRMRMLAWQAQRSRVQHTPDEVYAVTLGRDIPRMLPSELIRLTDPDLEETFYRDLIEGRLLQYELNRPAKEMRGPIVVAIDESGSMAGTADAWAKAAFLALHGIARSQGRAIRLIHFSGGTQTHVHDWTADEKPDPQKLMDAVLLFLNGGTEYDEWMRLALEAINESAYERADVICISDGAAYVQEATMAAWNEARAAKRFSSYGILIQDYGGAGTIAEICSQWAVLRFSALGDSDKDTDVLLGAFGV